METEHNIKLSASEISQLWSSYMNSSMCKCIFIHFLRTMEDTQMRHIIEHGFEIAETHFQKTETDWQINNFWAKKGE